MNVRSVVYALALAGLGVAPAASAQAPTASLALAAEAQAAAPSAEELLRGEIRAAVARVIDSGAFADTPPEAIALSLSLPSERSVDLGLLLDTREDGEGVRVLGVSPGGAGQSLGVRAGDRLVAVDGQRLSGLGRDAGGAPRALALLKATVESRADGAPLALGLVRDGRPLEISGVLAARYLPAVRIELGEGTLVASTAPAALARAAATSSGAAGDGGCGRISVFHLAPRSQDMYRARVIAIDGKLPGPAVQDTYRVSPGRHELLIAEDIDSSDLPSTYTRIRHRIGRAMLSVDVRPDTTYMIAAHLNPETRNDTRTYWNPVVWKEITEACR